MDSLKTLVTSEEILHWIIILFLVGYFIYKEWPEAYRRLTGRALERAQDAAQDKSIDRRLTIIEEDIKKIKSKLDTDYNRLNDMERWKSDMKGIVEDSLEERKIIMEALLGVLGGLQEIGANGPTKDAEKKINDYMIRKSHEREERKG